MPIQTNIWYSDVAERRSQLCFNTDILLLGFEELYLWKIFNQVGNSDEIQIKPIIKFKFKSNYLI